MGWFFILVKGIKLDFFGSKKPNDFFAWISKSKFKYGEQTNNRFFSAYISRGYYRTNMVNNMLEVELYVLLKERVNVNTFTLNLKLRLGKKGFPFVDAKPINSEWVTPLFFPKYYRKFGN